MYYFAASLLRFSDLNFGASNELQRVDGHDASRRKVSPTCDRGSTVVQKYSRFDRRPSFERSRQEANIALLRHYHSQDTAIWVASEEGKHPLLVEHSTEGHTSSVAPLLPARFLSTHSHLGPTVAIVSMKQPSRANWRILTFEAPFAGDPRFGAPT